jgi:hypothetical protein
VRCAPLLRCRADPGPGLPARVGLELGESAVAIIVGLRGGSLPGRGCERGPATSSPPCCPSANLSRAPEHPDTLTTRANLAAWTGQAGDAAANRGQLAALVSTVKPSRIDY